ncbi:hypothetical protein F4780DRAFT_786383 [Xylariomycetidae sp. FL0641]|nr:hypothetical protein F4780DRAFT_786383 [Xylariomycetidae sp. FL0641]
MTVTSTTTSSGMGNSDITAGTIAAIAIAGAIVVFVLLGSVLVLALRRRHHHHHLPAGGRDIAACPISGSTFAAVHPEHDLFHPGTSPRRLRKRSLVLAGSSSSEEVAEVRQPGAARRRTPSWVDADALHGPTTTMTTTTTTTMRKTAGNWSWLGRTFSLRRRPDDNDDDRTPTLPGDLELGAAPPPRGGAYHRHHRSYGEEIVIVRKGSPAKAARASDPGPRPSAASITPCTCGSHHHHHSNNNNGSNHDKEDKHGVAFDAAQRLAGNARVPLPVLPPIKFSATDAELRAILRRTAERQQQQQQDEEGRPRRQTMTLPASATTGGIMMRTPGAAVQGRARTQTLGGPATADDRRDGASPARSQRSAPANDVVVAPSVSELEGCSPRVRAPAPAPAPPPAQTPTRRHTRQVSAVSLVSEADSLVVQPPTSTTRRESGGAPTTPLSSPSRVRVQQQQQQQQHQATPTRVSLVMPTPATTPAPVPGSNRPYSAGSTASSSALSTLYSEEEEEDSIGECRPRTSDDDDDDRRRSGGRKPPKRFPFEDGQSPRPLRIRKGTLGETTLRSGALSSSAGKGNTNQKQQQQQQQQDGRVPQTSQTFTIHALDAAAEDPFSGATHTPPPPPIPARGSRLFPAPAELACEEVVGKPKGPRSPPPQPRICITAPTTPSPTQRRGVVPPPHTLRAMTSSPTLGGGRRRGAASPAPSERSGLSSVYESYSYEASARASSVVVVVDAAANQEAVPRQVSSAYSQDDACADDDDERDTVAPLRTSRRHGDDDRDGNQLASAVAAELRRMNSAVSSASTALPATLEGPPSPTLAELRGGGFSPGRQGGGGGVRNYLALGSPERKNAGAGDDEGKKKNEKSLAVSIVEAKEIQNVTVRRGRHTRRGTVIMRFEEDLDRARAVLRERNAAAAAAATAQPHTNTPSPQPKANIGAARNTALVTHATKLMREEEGRASLESLGLYDEKGFLKSSPMRQEVAARRA